MKYLTSPEFGASLPSVHTPWTPLAASPVIEETFKKIVQQQKGKVRIALPSFIRKTVFVSLVKVIVGFRSLGLRDVLILCT